MTRAPEDIAPKPRPPVRRRRTRDEVAERIRDAARALFAERGYAAATTKEIARRADASETLLFRYHKGKAALFEEVVSAPFNQLMQDFVAAHADQDAEVRWAEDTRAFVTTVFRLLDDNRDLLSAVVSTPVPPADDADPRDMLGLEDYFAQSVIQLEKQHAAAGTRMDFDPYIGVRLSFGMIAAGVLLRDWLFPAGRPPADALTTTLECLITRAMGPGASVDDCRTDSVK